MVMVLSVWFVNRNPIGETEKIERNPYGGTDKRVRITMQVEGQDEEEIEFDVSPRKYTEEEIQALFEQAIRRLEEVVKGENESLDHVEKDLNFPTVLDGLPFRISWEMDRYDVIGMDGRLQEEVLKKVDADGVGVLVTVTGIFSYGDWEAAHEMSARICKPEEKEQSFREKILCQIQEEDTNTASEPYLKLPKSIDGIQVAWKQEKTSMLPTVILMTGMLLLLLAIREKQKKEEQIKERKQQMIIDYPEILGQFALLLNAGMTVRNTWQKIVEDYQRQKKKSGRERAAYEEMVFTWKEMQSGISEIESYERFSKRICVPEYRKMGMIFAQNTKKGVKGTAELLNLEMTDVMEERKSRARRSGEEAGTKLLMPMMLMLIVVMLIVVVPAFWSVQI